MIISVIVLTSMMLGCDTVDPVTDYPFTVQLVDTEGVPITEGHVKAVPSDMTRDLDPSGVARFESLPKSTTSLTISRDKYPDHSVDVDADMIQEGIVTVRLATRLQLDVLVQDDHERPVAGVVVHAMPADIESVTGEDGLARINTDDAGVDKLVVKRELYDDHTVQVAADTLLYSELLVTVPTRGPIIEILSPIMNNSVIPSENLRFHSEVYDPEDGAIADVTWESDIAGVLGTGTDFTLSHIVSGVHNITCTARDKDGNETISSFSLMVSENVNNDSYFPVGSDLNWDYHHPVGKYLVEVDSDYDLWAEWAVDDIFVHYSDGRRITNMSFRYSLRNIVKYYEYTVIDEVSVVGNAIYVTGTTELVTVRDNSPSNELYQRAEVVTTYTPEYLLITDFYDPLAIPSYSSTVRADLAWTFDKPFQDEFSFTESYEVTTDVTVGAPVEVHSLLNTMEGVPITFTQGDIRKTWWLVPGYGITRMEYNSYDEPAAALLEKYYVGNAREKPIMSAPSLASRKNPVSQSPQSNDEGDYQDDISRIKALRSIASGYMLH